MDYTPAHRNPSEPSRPAPPWLVLLAFAVVVGVTAVIAVALLRDSGSDAWCDDYVRDLRENNQLVADDTPVPRELQDRVNRDWGRAMEECGMAKMLEAEVP